MRMILIAIQPQELLTDSAEVGADTTAYTQAQQLPEKEEISGGASIILGIFAWVCIYGIYKLIEEIQVSNLEKKKRLVAKPAPHRPAQAQAVPIAKKDTTVKPKAPIKPLVTPISIPAPSTAGQPTPERKASPKLQPDQSPLVTRPTPSRAAPEPDNVPGEIKYVTYIPLPSSSGQQYPLVRMPEIGKRIPIKFPRAGRSGQRGYCEDVFVERLRRHFPQSGPVKIFADRHLPTGNTARPYEPDIVIASERKGSTIFLDIEIDEPYDGVYRQPTHCKGDDNSRDLFFTRRGWIVLRFAEIQIHEQPDDCCVIIARLLAKLDPEYQVPSALAHPDGLNKVLAWDMVQAQKWAKEKYREKYLGLTNGFGRYDTSEVWKSADALPVEAQIEAIVAQAAPLPMPSRAGRLQKASPELAQRTSALRFDAANHQYYINGQPATAVSTLVGRFFTEFDTDYWSAVKAAERGCSPAQVAKEWADDGNASSTAGTALHQQIELFYNDGTQGAGADFAQFLAFHRSHTHLKPYRTEWQIYNEDLMLAGTVDFVAQNNDGTVSIYDWKRSSKLIDRSGKLINSSSFRNAEGPLKDLPDCKFSQHTLQQNIYKWLLESKYGCRVKDMNLVVLHPKNSRYHVVNVPERTAHVQQMLASMKAQRS